MEFACRRTLYVCLNAECSSNVVLLQATNNKTGIDSEMKQKNIYLFLSK